jgi:hypothetical protein
VDQQDLEALWQRVERSVSALNAGNPEPMLTGYAEDVEVRIPFYRADDPAGPPTIRGKAAYREYLLDYMARHGVLTVVSVQPLSAGMMVHLLDSGGRALTLSVTLDSQGIARAATVFTA